jgi:hypothetical protein
MRGPEPRPAYRDQAQAWHAQSSQSPNRGCVGHSWVAPTSTPGETSATAMTVRYPTTVTCQSSGRPGTGVHGVGLHTSRPATNGTSTVADPGPIALRLAVKLVPEALLDVRANTRPLEMVGGPGQVPPDMSSPPVSTRVEPTVTHTVVTPSDDCHLTLTVPLVH